MSNNDKQLTGGSAIGTYTIKQQLDGGTSNSIFSSYKENLTGGTA